QRRDADVVARAYGEQRRGQSAHHEGESASRGESHGASLGGASGGVNDRRRRKIHAAKALPAAKSSSPVNSCGSSTASQAAPVRNTVRNVIVLSTACASIDGSSDPVISRSAPIPRPTVNAKGRR